MRFDIWCRTIAPMSPQQNLPPKRPMIDPRARRYNLIIKQGSTFRQGFRYVRSAGDELRDYTGYTGRGQIRKKPGAAIIASFDIAFEPATTGYHGSLVAGLTDEQTILIKPNCRLDDIPAGYQFAVGDDLPPKRYWYDIEIESPTGVVTREFEGFVLVTPEVTRLITAPPVDEVAPTLLSAIIPNAAPNTVVLTFNENLDTTAPAGSAFEIGGVTKTVTGVTISGATATLTVNTPFVFGVAPTVAYTPPGSNPLQDAAGNTVVAILATPITNNMAPPSDTTAPAFSSAVVTDFAPDVVVLTFSENLSGSAPENSAFVVSGKTVTGVSIAGTEVSLSITPAFGGSDAAEITYTPPGSNPLQDAAGNTVVGFSAFVELSTPTESFAIPATEQVVKTQRVGSDGIRLFYAPSTSVSDLNTDSPWVDFELKIGGGASNLVRLYAFQARFFKVPENSTISVWSASDSGVGIIYQSVTLPSVTPSLASPTAATLTVERNVPPYWSPNIPNITFASDSLIHERVFSLPANLDQAPVFVSEYDGVAWTPARFYRPEKNKATVIQCTYRQVALAVPAGGSTVAVGVPSGAVTANYSGGLVDFVPTPTITNTVNVSNSSELLAAINAATSGTEIVCATGSYSVGTVNNASWASSVQGAGVLIRSASGVRSDVVISGSWNVASITEQAVHQSFKNLTLDVTGGTFLKIGGSLSLHNCLISGPSALGSDLFSVASASGSTFTGLFAYCDFEGNSPAAQSEDVVNGSGAWAANGVTFVCCNASGSGQGLASQVITGHFGSDITWLGGIVREGNGTDLVANDSNTTNYFYFTRHLADGLAGNVSHSVCYGCDTTSETSILSIVTARSNLLRNITSTALFQGNLVEATTSVVRLIFNNTAGGYTVRDNVFTGALEVVLVEFASGGPYPRSSVSNNTFSGCTRPIRLINNNCPIDLTNNLTHNSGDGVNVSAAAMAVITGGNNRFDKLLGTTYTGLSGDINSINPALDSDLVPTFMATGDATDLLLGSSDYTGKVLYYGVNPTQGARAATTTTGIVFPDAAY